MATPPTNASPRLPRPNAYASDFEYEDKPAVPPPPPRRPHNGSTASSSVASAASPLRARHSESELLRSPRDADEYPHYEARKRMSADFSDDTMSVGSLGGESPKSDRGNWRLHSAVAGPFLTGPLAKDFQSEHLKTPRGKARDDLNFDYSGLLFPLAPVLDAIPDTPRGGFNPQAQSFTDISQFENSSAPMDGFHLDGGAPHAARRGAPGAPFQSHSGHASYADVMTRNGSSGGASEQSLVASSGSDALESLSKGMADSMAQILAKTQNGRSYNEVQLTSLVQKIHLHMTIMGRTSAAIREDYNRIKAKLEQTITDKKVLEATNYHLQQLVQQYEVERQYFHQYVLHSLQSQSSLIYESMGNLSQNVEQSKATIEELSARLSRELSNIQGSRGGNDSQLKEILEEIKRAMDVGAVTGMQQDTGRQSNTSPARSPHHPAAKSLDSEAKGAEGAKSNSGGGFKLTSVLLGVLLWVATLGGVYFSAKSAALTELQQQQQPPSSSSSPSLSSIRPSDLELIVNQISQKLDSSIQASEVRKLVFTELKQNPQLAESIVVDAVEEKDAGRESLQHHDEKEDTSEYTTLQPETTSAGSTSSEDAESDAAVGEGVPKADEEAAVPVEPTVEIPSLPTTAAPEVVPETKHNIAEVEIPTAKHFQVPDAAIAEMLRLNGLPAGVIPFDKLPGSVVGSVHPPSDVVDVVHKVPEIEDTASESAAENAAVESESTVKDEQTKTNVADESASLSSKESGADEEIASGDDQAAESAADANEVTETTGSVLDSITGSIPFTGLSKALKSLAHRFVEGGETVTSIDIVGGAKQEETGEVKTHESGEAKLEVGVDGALTAGAESIPGAAEPAFESALTTDMTERTIEAGTDSTADLVTVVVAVEGDVADSTPTDVVHDAVPVQADDAVVEVAKGDVVSTAEDAADRADTEAASDDEQMKETTEDKIVVDEKEMPISTLETRSPETTTSEDVGAPLETATAAASLADTPEIAVVGDELVADKGDVAFATVEDDESLGLPVVVAVAGDVVASVADALPSYESRTELKMEHEQSKEPSGEITTGASIADEETSIDAIGSETPLSVDVHAEAASAEGEASIAVDGAVTLAKASAVGSESTNLGAETIETADKSADAEAPVSAEASTGERAVADDAIGSVDAVDTSEAMATSSADDTVAAAAAAAAALATTVAEETAGEIAPVATAVVESLGVERGDAEAIEADEAPSEETSLVAAVAMVEDEGQELDDADGARDVVVVDAEVPESSSDEPRAVAAAAAGDDGAHAEL
ncbi:hypothetical protein PybrP1_011048 [[Pythium] brassicae (nom. inval.)]|nr:hypothetical protein PybrP1_011048 [[Pythium] brassicae (nom. inval.)]